MQHIRFICGYRVYATGAQGKSLHRRPGVRRR